MLYRNLLRHQWKEFIRNPSWSSISVAYAIFLVLLALYFLLNLALAGAFIGHFLTSQDPAADVVRVVNRHLLNGFLLLFPDPPKRRPGTAQRAGRVPRRRLEGLHGILPRPLPS